MARAASSAGAVEPADAIGELYVVASEARAAREGHEALVSALDQRHEMQAQRKERRRRDHATKEREWLEVLRERQRALASFVRAEEAATRIQASVRGHLARRQMVNLSHTRLDLVAKQLRRRIEAT